LSDANLSLDAIAARLSQQSAEFNMPQKRRDLISTFVAKDDAGGKLMIYHYRESVLQPGPDGGSTWAPTKDILVTEDGRDVSRKDKGVYEIRSTRGPLILKSDAAEAP
jgi:hypothetical protein